MILVLLWQYHSQPYSFQVLFWFAMQTNSFPCTPHLNPFSHFTWKLVSIPCTNMSSNSYKKCIYSILTCFFCPNPFYLRIISIPNLWTISTCCLLHYVFEEHKNIHWVLPPTMSAKCALVWEAKWEMFMFQGYTL